MTARIDLNVEMSTRDGVTLRADVFRPEGADAVPAVVLRTPYNKDHRRVRLDGFDPVTAVVNGYAFVIQDVRGRWASDGEYMPISRVEGPDGYDCIEWVAAQPWCDGNVGMVGISYESLAQLMAAEEQPPHLRAIIPEYSGDSRLSFMRLDSVMIGWAAQQAADWLQKKIATGEARTSDLEVVARAMHDPQATAWHLPLDEMPLMKVAALPSYAEMVNILRSVAGVRFDRIQVPMLLVSGWYDIDPLGINRFFVEARATGATETSRRDTAILWGPWEHGIPFFSVGEGYYGLHAAADGAPQIRDLYLRFLARHLKGEPEVGIPTATYFLMGRNEWRTADSWPPRGVVRRLLYLNSEGSANSLDGDGSLAMDAPGRESIADEYTYDPADPVMSLGGRHFKIGGTLPGPFDQRRIEIRPDVLVYSTPPLTEPVDMIGDCRLRIFVTTDVVDTDFVAKVCDVSPSGMSHNITDGILRTKWRDGAEEPSLLEPGLLYELVIEMGPVAHCFLEGHRLRVQLSSSSFPGYDRNMNTGRPEGVDAVGVIAHHRVWHGGDRPSLLEFECLPPEHGRE